MLGPEYRYRWYFFAVWESTGELGEMNTEDRSEGANKHPFGPLAFTINRKRQSQQAVQIKDQ